MTHCVVGVDFGTLSVRALVVAIDSGAELGTGVASYRHAVIDQVLPATGAELPPDWALQDADDYPAALAAAVRDALADAAATAGVTADDVLGIATDFTACTVLPTTTDGTPLSRIPAYRDCPHAYVKLWRHHAAQDQANRITDLARGRDEPWLPFFGGRISAEWELAKAWQLLEEDPEVYAATAHWVEAADWIVWQLTGRYVRNACTAGYKAQFHDGAYPSEAYFAALDPRFGDFARTRLKPPDGRLGARAGALTADSARQLGLRPGTPVAVGNVDAHVTAAAANAVDAGHLVAIMGTSTCHILNADTIAQIPGMCGAVFGGVVSGLWGYEAGQSGVGDIFGHYVDGHVPVGYLDAARAQGRSLHEHLSFLADADEPGSAGLLALDWHSGNRSVLVDHQLSGMVLGLTLHTRPEEIYRALIEATAFGARMIVDAFTSGGLPVHKLTIAGGLKRNPFVMQTYADVLDRPLSVVDSAHGPALGSAVHAAVAAGAYADVRTASAAMSSRSDAAYRPRSQHRKVYDELYGHYRRLHDYFGRGENEVLHALHAMRSARSELVDAR